MTSKITSVQMTECVHAGSGGHEFRFPRHCRADARVARHLRAYHRQPAALADRRLDPGAAAGAGARLFLVSGAARSDAAGCGIWALALLEDLLSGGAPGVWAAAFLRPTHWSNASAINFGGLVRIRRHIRFCRRNVCCRGRLPIFLRRSIYLAASPPLAPLLLQSAVTVVVLSAGGGC